ncbi:MAG: GIY-YIG nuclease family protein [Candidatus Falkowbacteria bacterium]|nr:GIY-YIG nuclease family protein [Candidatus Falkowbacteria bacterium]
MPSYFVYIIRCADNSLYTGITTDIARRFAEHQKGGKGAKYTTSHPPVDLVYQKKFPNRSEASAEEARIKRLNRSDKLEFINSK